MPEGDTIFRAAQTLHRALAGRTVTGFESVYPALTRVDDDTPVVGRTIEAVTRARQASADGVLRRPRAAHAHADARQLAHLPARRALAAAGARHARARRDRRIRGGRPSTCRTPSSSPGARWIAIASCSSSAPTCSIRPSMRRSAPPDARRHDRDPIGEVLLNQRVIAGIGNVFKSEILFMAGVHPFTPTTAVSDDALRRVLEISVDAAGDRTSPTVRARSHRRRGAGPPAACTRRKGCGSTDARGNRAAGAARPSCSTSEEPARD